MSQPLPKNRLVLSVSLAVVDLAVNRFLFIADIDTIPETSPLKSMPAETIALNKSIHFL